MSANALPPSAYNLLELYRQHRDEIDALTDPTSLFILAFTEHNGSATLDELAGDLILTPNAVRVKLTPLLRGQMMRELNGSLSVTALGRRILTELGFIPPLPPGPTEPPKKPEPPQPPKPPVAHAADAPSWLWGVIAFLGTGAVVLIAILIASILLLPGIVPPRAPTSPPIVATDIPPATNTPIPSLTSPPTSTRTPTPSQTPTATPTTRAVTEVPLDTQGPPPPVPIAPINNQTIGCRAQINLMLQWNAVSDPSGIANYRIQLQRLSGNVWQDLRTFDAGNVTQAKPGDLQCGIFHRWNVTARDNAGNTGKTSDWAQFGIGID